MRVRTQVILLIVALLAPTSLLYAFAESPAAADNLIGNGDFEAGDVAPTATDGWILCGGAQIVEAEAHGGRYAMRMGQPIDSSCGNDTLGPAQAAAEDVTIPSNAQDVTISFWYRATGTYSVGEVVLTLGEKPTSYLGSRAFISELNMDEVTPGWQLFRQNLSGEALEAVRGQTLYLNFQVRFAGEPSDDWAIYFDDVRVVPSWERTQPSAFPADLRSGGLYSNGTQPLLVRGLGQTPDQGGIQRMDTDGGNRVLIHESLIEQQSVTWSPDGTQIAFTIDRVYPDPPLGADKFHARVSDTFVMNANGSNVRQIFQTTGVVGRKENPVGCLRTNSCIDTGQDAIDLRLDNLAWSPDGSELVTTYCNESRWWNSEKEIRGCSHELGRHALPSDGSVVDITLPDFINVAQNASWNASGQLLFERPPSIGGSGPLAPGIYAAEMNEQPPTIDFVEGYLTGYSLSNNNDLRPSPYGMPTWAPDGRHFVTYRNAPGVRYVEKLQDDVTLSALRSNYAIMLHNRQSPAATRQLLYVDHGTLMGSPTWSPDGRYLLYVLYADNQDGADIWWLDVETGATGPVTNDGVSYEVDWQPVQRVASAALDVATSTALVGPAPFRPAQQPATQDIFLPTIFSRGSEPSPLPTAGTSSPTPAPTAGGDNPTPVPTTAPTSPSGFGVPVSFPTNTPSPVTTPLPAPVNPTPVPPRGISGFVTEAGAPVAGVNVQLEVCVVGLPCEFKERATTNANGQYNFPYAQPSIFGNQVTYRNGAAGENSLEEEALLYWQEPAIFDYDYAQRVEGGNFDIAAVELLGPADNARVPLPTTFSWRSRGIEGEQYRWYMDAPDDIADFCDQFTPDTNTEWTVSSLDCSVFPELQPNEPYPWQVEVSNGAGGIGQSHVRTVVFTE